MQIKEKQKKILEILKDEGEIATTKIAFLVSINYYQAEVFLEELLNEGYIERIEKDSSTYWKLKKEEEKW